MAPGHTTSGTVREGWSGPPRPAAVEAAVKDIRLVSGRGFVPSPTDNFEVQEDIGKMRPVGKLIKFQRKPGHGATSGGVSVNPTSKTVMSEGVDFRAMTRGKDAEGDRPDVVLSMIAGGVPSSTSADESPVDSDVTGVASLVVAEAACSADFAGMAVPAIAGVASPAVLAGMAVPAFAGAASLAVVEVATSTNRMEAAGSVGVCGVLVTV